MRTNNIVHMTMAADVEKTIFFTRIIIVCTKHGVTRVTIIIIIAKTSSLPVDNIRPGPVCNARVFANSSILMASDQNINPAGFEGDPCPNICYVLYIH